MLPFSLRLAKRIQHVSLFGSVLLFMTKVIHILFDLDMFGAFAFDCSNFNLVAEYSISAFSMGFIDFCLELF